MFCRLQYFVAKGNIVKIILFSDVQVPIMLHSNSEIRVLIKGSYLLMYLLSLPKCSMNSSEITAVAFKCLTFVSTQRLRTNSKVTFIFLKLCFLRATGD
jgi:hypothetical protein